MQPGRDHAARPGPEYGNGPDPRISATELFPFLFFAEANARFKMGFFSVETQICDSTGIGGWASSVLIVVFQKPNLDRVCEGYWREEASRIARR